MTWKGWENFAPVPPATKRGKYGNAKTAIDGLLFASKREAARYQVLKMRLQAGEIRQLQLQPRFALSAGGHEVAEYVADFHYQERVDQDWLNVIEDVKGARTDVYKLKRKWFEAQYGIQIRET